MEITLFSSNQPRHLSLANKLANFCDELYFVSEVKTLFPEHSIILEDPM